MPFVFEHISFYRRYVTLDLSDPKLLAQPYVHHVDIALTKPAPPPPVKHTNIPKDVENVSIPATPCAGP